MKSMFHHAMNINIGNFDTSFDTSLIEFALDEIISMKYEHRTHACAYKHKFSTPIVVFSNNEKTGFSEFSMWFANFTVANLNTRFLMSCSQFESLRLFYSILTMMCWFLMSALQ